MKQHLSCEFPYVWEMWINLFLNFHSFEEWSLIGVSVCDIINLHLFLEMIKHLVFGTYWLSVPVSLKSTHRISGATSMWSSFWMPGIFERSSVLPSASQADNNQGGKCHQASEKCQDPAEVVTSELLRAFPLPALAAGDFKTLAPHPCLGLG